MSCNGVTARQREDVTSSRTPTTPLRCPNIAWHDLDIAGHRETWRGFRNMGGPWGSESDASVPPGPEMLKLCMSVYWHCLENGGYDEKRLSQELETPSRTLEAACAELVRLRLLRA